MPPIFALVDFDPDGIAIMSTYKYGSWKLSHENARLNVPGIRWLGLRSRYLFDDSRGLDGNGHLPLSIRDRKMAKKMLEESRLRDCSGESEWRRELQVMLMLGLKAEMEILDDGEGGIERWLEEVLMEELAYDKHSIAGPCKLAFTTE